METMFAPPLRMGLQITFQLSIFGSQLEDETEKSNLSNARRIAWKYVIHFGVSFVFLLRLRISFLFCFMAFRLLIFEVNYNCIETMVFQILCMYKTQWRSINNYCCKMQMKTLGRRRFWSDGSLGIMMCVFTLKSKASKRAEPNRLRTVDAEWLHIQEKRQQKINESLYQQRERMEREKNLRSRRKQSNPFPFPSSFVVCGNEHGQFIYRFIISFVYIKSKWRISCILWWIEFFLGWFYFSFHFPIPSIYFFWQCKI